MVFELDGDYEEQITQLELMGYNVEDMIDIELDRYQLMGYDRDDPELMGGILKRIIARIRARRAARKAGQIPAGSAYNVSTPSGTAGYSPATGLTYQDAPAPGSAGTEKQSVMDKIKENPLLIAIPAGALLLVMMQNK